ncbi:unnamed protein product [Cylicostephanus goldi]|uniref:Uncharacterized protein n=1 Tax=Cylicostephanus goldi TaxID=71465 RepID=A0A3P6QY00_CYLGO|nr:unnamed protein product [Cylicostephanus goldi]
MEQPGLVSTPKTAAESKPASHSEQHVLTPQALPVVNADHLQAKPREQAGTVSDTTAKVQKEHAPVKRDLKEVKKENSVNEHKQEEHKKEAKEKEEHKKVKKEEEASVTAKSHGNTKKVTSKTISTKKSEKIKLAYEKRALRLENNIVNCLQVSSPDLLGFGRIDVSQKNAYRVCIACLVLSIFGVALSVLHHYINLAPPPRVGFFYECGTPFVPVKLLP